MNSDAGLSTVLGNVDINYDIMLVREYIVRTVDMKSGTMLV